MQRGTNNTAKRRQRAAIPLRAGIPVLLCAVVVLLASAPPRFNPRDEVEASARARAVFGFRTDDASHEAALASDASESSLARYGMALTREELEEMDRRQDVVRRMPSVEGALRSEAPESFAAMYIDNDDEGAVVVLATRPSEIDSRKVADLVDGKPFAIRRVDRSANELQADYDWLWRRAEELRASGEDGLTGFVLDERGNTIRVFVKDRSARGRVASALAADGAPSYLEFAEATFGQESAVRGGDELSACSAGPQVYADSPSGRLYYTLTAKHCANQQTHRKDGAGCAKHNLPHAAAAQPNQTVYGPTLWADVQMHVSGASAGYVAPVWPAWPAIPVVDESHLYGWGYLDTIGMTVCRRGMATAPDCGELVYKYFVYWEEGFGAWLTEQRVASYTSAGGDSGGIVYTPVADGAAVLGGHVGVITADPDPDLVGLKIYSHIWFMKQEIAEQGKPFIVQRWWD